MAFLRESVTLILTKPILYIDFWNFDFKFDHYLHYDWHCNLIWSEQFSRSVELIEIKAHLLQKKVSSCERENELILQTARWWSIDEMHFWEIYTSVNQS